MTNDHCGVRPAFNKTYRSFVIRQVSFVIFSSLIILHSSLATAQVDTAKIDTAGFHMTKSPLEALLLSAVVPGAGQVYLDQAWKVPVIWGLGGAFLYGVLIQNYRYHYMQDSVTNAINRYHVTGNQLDSLWSLAYANAREFYRDDRDKWWIYIGLTYIANVLDAYIAANLYDFDVSTPSASPIGTYYRPDRHEVGLTFTIKY
jgi:hypothetical protein